MVFILRIIAAVVIPLALAFSAACAPSAPTLPTDTSPPAIAMKMAGSGGPAFLSDITHYEWSDDGARAGELLSWIPRDAGSSDPIVAARAGKTAHVVGGFLADQYMNVKGAGAKNPALIQSYAATLIPYLGAMVGDPMGTSDFEPLDGLDTEMPRTASVFAVMASDPKANSMFTEAADNRAAAYEREFADVAAANPSSADSPAQQDNLARAARLLGLNAAGARLAGKESQNSTTSHAKTNLAYVVVSRMLRGQDPHFSLEYFTPNGSLKSPDQVGSAQWSLYDAQLFNYLATYPAITDAIYNFGRTYGSIAGS
jgi:hypothetical protein